MVRVVVAEPDDDVRECLVAYLEGRGVEVVDADGRAVLLCALRLSAGDAAARVAAARAAGGAAVVTATVATAAEVERVMRAGAEAVLFGPLRMAEVYDAVEQAGCRARERAREAAARGLLLDAGRVGPAALRARLDADAALLAEDPALFAACVWAVERAGG